MAINTSETNMGLGDVIANNIPSRAFRYTAENKNVLSEKGAIYVGTGDTRETKMLLDYETYDPEKTYEEGDYVEYSGFDYRCKQTAQGEAPTTGGNDDEYWALDTIAYESKKTGVLLPPTTEGFYIMACSVDSNGVATIGWVQAPSGLSEDFVTTDGPVGVAESE